MAELDSSLRSGLRVVQHVFVPGARLGGEGQLPWWSPSPSLGRNMQGPWTPRLGKDTPSLPPKARGRHKAKPKVKDAEHRPCLPLEWEEQPRLMTKGVDTGRNWGP